MIDSNKIRKQKLVYTDKREKKGKSVNKQMKDFREFKFNKSSKQKKEMKLVKVNKNISNEIKEDIENNKENENEIANINIKKIENIENNQNLNANQFFLNFIYNGKEVYLDCEPDESFNNILSKLLQKYEDFRKIKIKKLVNNGKIITDLSKTCNDLKF